MKLVLFSRRLFDRVVARAVQPGRLAVGSHGLAAQSRHRVRQLAQGDREALHRAVQTTRRRETQGALTHSFLFLVALRSDLVSNV